MKPDEVLDRTADKLESGEWTWFQYVKGSPREPPSGHYCASEALWKVAMSDWSLGKDIWPIWLNVLRAMDNQIRSQSLAHWNDRVAKDKEQVIAAMRAAAQSIREQET